MEDTKLQTNKECICQEHHVANMCPDVYCPVHGDPEEAARIDRENEERWEL